MSIYFVPSRQVSRRARHCLAALYLILVSFSPLTLMETATAALPYPVMLPLRFADEKAHCVKVEGTRLRINVGDKNAYRMQFAEIEIYVHNPTGDQHSTFNIAPGATVIASSSFEYVGWSTEKVNDGEWDSVPGTLGWSSNDNLAADHTEWIQLNLGGSYTIGKVDLYPRNDAGAVGEGFPIDFNIQVTDDVTCAAGWTTVVQRTDYPRPGDAGQSFNFAKAS